LRRRRARSQQEFVRWAPRSWNRAPRAARS
jgi:hypothetical protein